MNELLQALQDLRFSAGLSDEDLGKLVAISQLVEFPAGATIFSEGDQAHSLFLIKQGRVELRMCAPARGCQSILTVEGGDLLGWSPALFRREMTATAVAIAPTQTIQISANDLRALCDADHDIGYEMMRRIAVALASRLVAARLQVLDLHKHSVPNMPHPSAEGPS